MFRFALLVVGLALVTVPVWAKDRGVIYVPKTHHLPLDECKKKYPPEKIGGFCDFYGGADEPEKCARGYHADGQQACFGYGAAEIPTLRTVCHKNGSPVPADQCGISCTEKKAK